MTIDEKFARLRALYPGDIPQIEAEEHRVYTLLKGQEYYNNPQTQALIALCRREVVAARMRLAKERSLDEQARAELWLIIDARSWFLEMVAKDYDSEIAQIDSQLEADLQA